MLAAPVSSAMMLGDCDAGDLSLKVTACTGFSQENLLAPNPWQIEHQITELASLGFAFDGDYKRVEQGMIWSDFHGFYELPGQFFGTGYLGISRRNPELNHVQTAFFRVEGAGESSFSFKWGKESPVVFFNPSFVTAAIPEPGSWALMLLGFAAVGSVLRRTSRDPIRFRANTHSGLRN